jgi:hypothetical protein
VYGGAQHCKARRCRRYAPIWARDQQRKLFENLGSYSDGEGHAVMFTVTPPGADVLPWDTEHCKPLGEHRHGGDYGCRVVPAIARAWNRAVSTNWRHLHDRCARLAACETGRRPHLLARAFEHQKRGVLHVHAVIARGTHLDRLAAAAYGRHLSRLASRYGFGRVDTPSAPARVAREAAAYISSYLSSEHGGKRTLGETVRSDQMPVSIIHVSTRLTRATGCTMRVLRFQRLVHNRWGVRLPFLELRQVKELVDRYPGCELVAHGGPRAPPRESRVAA